MRAGLRQLLLIFREVRPAGLASVHSGSLLLAVGSAAVVALVACATSGGEEASLAPPNDAGVSSVPEAEPPADGGAKVEDAGARPLSSCSDAGWCATELPDDDLVLKDIWPFEERAFAIAESDTLGTKLLEWVESSASWSYVDDNTQNAYDSGQYAGKVWAPSENEVYYATAPGLIYHGTRANPSSPFSWDSARLPYEGPDFGPDDDPGRAWRSATEYNPLRHRWVPSKEYVPAVGVWGTSADDVYAWYGKTIFRRTSVDGGPPTWVAEHVVEGATTPEERFYVFGAAGSSSDEVWFIGGHGTYDAANGFTACSMLIRRTPDGYAPVMDHSLESGSCQPKAGTLSMTSKFTYPGYGTFEVPVTVTGWATSVASPRPGTAVALVDSLSSFFVYVDISGAGIARYNPLSVSRNPTSPPGDDSVLTSIWIHGDHAWLSGWGLVIDGENKPEAWAECYGLKTPEQIADYPLEIDGGATYSISSTAINGAPLEGQLYQVRGSSNDNLWAVGSRYALHKNNP